MPNPLKSELLTAIKVLRWYADELGDNGSIPCSHGMELVDFIADRLQVRADGLEKALCDVVLKAMDETARGN